MADPTTPRAQPSGATGVIVFADGRTIWGRGFGAEGEAVGELCFNTAMTGYQEVMTDPSYAKQVIAFTFPHIGNVGANAEDIEADAAHALGCIVREEVTRPSNFRSEVIAAWLNFYVLARTSEAAARLLRIYHRRLRSNLAHDLRPLLGAGAMDAAERLAALIDGMYLKQGLAGGPADGPAATRQLLAALELELK